MELNTVIKTELSYLGRQLSAQQASMPDLTFLRNDRCEINCGSAGSERVKRFRFGFGFVLIARA